MADTAWIVPLWLSVKYAPVAPVADAMSAPEAPSAAMKPPSRHALPIAMSVSLRAIRLTPGRRYPGPRLANSG